MSYEKSQRQVLINHSVMPFVYSHECVATSGNERLDLGTEEGRETGQLKRVCRLEESRNVAETHATVDEESSGWWLWLPDWVQHSQLSGCIFPQCGL